jgi:hypothetical protein
VQEIQKYRSIIKSINQSVCLSNYIFKVACIADVTARTGITITERDQAMCSENEKRNNQVFSPA